MIDDMPPAYQVLPEVIVELELSKNEGQHITSKQTERSRSWGANTVRGGEVWKVLAPFLISLPYNW